MKIVAREPPSVVVNIPGKTVPPASNVQPLADVLGPPLSVKVKLQLAAPPLFGSFARQDTA
jgi:hypothetical protein